MKIYNTLRRLLAVSIFTIMITAAAGARDLARGYRGFFDINGEALFENKNSYYHHKDIVYSTLGFTTTHGYQFNRNFFLGAGTGLEAIIINTNYDIIHLGTPVYIMGRADWNIGRVPLYADLKVGTILELGYVDTQFTNLSVNPTIGYRADWGRRVALNIGIGFSVTCFDLDGIDNPGAVKLFPAARIGIEF